MVLQLKLFLVILSCHSAIQELEQFVQFGVDNIVRQRQAFFTKNFLKLYNGFSLMFHAENLTLNNIDYLSKIIHDDIFGQIVILNEDTLHSIDFQKRTGSPFLHLVILSNPRKFTTFLSLPGCLNYKDVVIFVIIGNNSLLKEKFWSAPRLDWAGNVIILTVFNTSLSIYNVCFYCGKFSKKLRHLQTNSSDVQLDTTELMPRNFTNFRQHRFKIGYIDSFPYMWCKRSEDYKANGEVFRRCTHASGLETGILGVLSEKLNFTYWLIEYGYSLSRSDKDINKGGTRKLDFIIGGLSVTAARAPKMSFTSTLAVEPYTFLYIPRKPSFSQVWDNFKPFQKIVWVTVVAATLWFSLGLYVCTQLMSDNVCKRHFPLSKCFKICFMAIIEQADKNLRLDAFRQHFTPYVVLVLWWFASTIFITAYKSKLWAISIKNYHVEPTNLQELLDNGYEIVVNSQNTDIIDDILHENEPMIMEAKRKLVLRNRTCGTLSYALNNKAAMLDEHATIQYHALVRCSEILGKDVYPKLRITKTPLRQTTHSWPLQMGAPYKYAFDVLIGRIEAAGLQRKWKVDSLSILRNKYDAIPYSQANAIDRAEEEGHLRKFVSSFVLYMFGNLIALLCFGVEIIYTKYLTRRK